MKHRIAKSRFGRALFIPVAAFLLIVRGAGASDCNSNGIDDLLDISNGTSHDCNANAVPDECDLSEESIVFEARAPLPAGFSTSLLAQDFDGDGDPDLMVSEFFGPGWHEGQPEDRALAYFRNLGQGRFDAPVRYELSDRPHALFAEDMDRDGDADVLVIFGQSDWVGLFRNRGDGTFEGPRRLSVGAGPTARVRGITADLDGDQDLDIVTTSADTSSISILLNRGDASFEPEPRLSLERAWKYSFADLDGDGDIDIAVITASHSDTEQGSLVVLWNDGHGAFPARDTYPLGTYLQEVAVADLDGDRDLDLVVVQERPRLLAVLKNRGDGKFDLAPPLDPGSVPGQSQPGHAIIVDVDNDGDADVITSADGLYGSREEVSLFLNRGDGTFDPRVPYLAGDQPEQLEVRDLNGDGRPEILALNYDSGDLTLLRNLGQGAFAEEGRFPITKQGAVSMRLADLDSDGDLDVAAVTLYQGTGLVILENISGGTFTGGCSAFRRGDVNSDGEVSLADVITIRRYLFEGSVEPTCLDAADATDNDEITLCDAIMVLNTIFRNPLWQDRLPAPSPEAGEDPTALGDSTQPCDAGNGRATRPLGCRDYRVMPPELKDDLLRVGDAVGTPGEPAMVPIHLTASVPVDAIQVVLSYDPAILEPVSISFESTYLEQFAQPFGALSAHPEEGIIVVGLAGSLFLPGSTVEPGDDILVAWINFRVRPDAPLGEIDVAPTNGPDGLGVGPYRLRNEITYKGDARLVSSLPHTQGGRMGIVGDQALFIRGDTNGDRMVDISDPVASLAWLFLGTARLDCEDAADANDDGAIDLSDAVFTLSYLFQGVRKPSAPFPELGIDLTPDSLGCRPVATGDR